MSRDFVTSCAVDSGCEGGLSRYTAELLAGATSGKGAGAPTGGTAGCSPYFGHGQQTNHFQSSNAASPCRATCGNTAYSRSLPQDLIPLFTTYRQQGMTNPWREIYRETNTTFNLAKAAIYRSRPLAMGMKVVDNFFGYSSGIYDDTDGCTEQANHEVTALGYGVDSKMGEYWIAMKS